MDWSNESYVRIYLRDTTTWKRLGWAGTSVLMHMLRKVDRAGVLDIEDMEPWEAVTLHCGAPEDVAKEGMEACLRLGVLQHNGARLVAPNFRDAQEAPKSDKLRQRESRERRQAEALSNVTERDDESHTVTDCHSESHAVTNGHAVSLLTVHDSAVHRDTSSSSPSPSEARLVFAHWVEVMGKPKAKLTKDRAAKVKARLRDGYSVEDLKRAVDGCKRSSFHMGDNANGQLYNDLATILRNGQTTDAHIERANGTPVAAAPTLKYGTSGAIGDEGAF